MKNKKEDKTKDINKNKEIHTLTKWDLYNYNLQHNKIEWNDYIESKKYLLDFTNNINW